LESNPKIVLAYEALGGPVYKDIFNDPESLKFLESDRDIPEAMKKEIGVFIEIEESYKGKFEIEPIGVSQDAVEDLDEGGISEEELKNYNRRIIIKEALDLFKRYKDTTALFYTDDGINLHKIYIYKRDKDAATVLFYTDVINVLDILQGIENNIK